MQHLNGSTGIKWSRKYIFWFDKVTQNKLLSHVHSQIKSIFLCIKAYGGGHIMPPHIYSGPECDSARGSMISAGYHSTCRKDVNSSGTSENRN